MFMTQTLQEYTSEKNPEDAENVGNSRNWGNIFGEKMWKIPKNKKMKSAENTENVDK